MTTAVSEPLVRFIDVRKSYDGKVDAVRALNLEIANGEFLTLLGPSGSGKTTTLTMLAGFEQPSAGRIFVGAEDITNVAVEKRGIGMVFQNYALFPNMTVGENIGFPLRVRRLAPAEIADRVKRALAMVRLEGLADRRPQQLSGGQQQRVAVARALVSNPKVILADEPTGNLDTANGNAVLDLLTAISKLGTTVVMVTHSLTHAAIADRTVKLLDGRVASETQLAA